MLLTFFAGSTGFRISIQKLLEKSLLTLYMANKITREETKSIWYFMSGLGSYTTPSISWEIGIELWCHTYEISLSASLESISVVTESNG